MWIFIVWKQVFEYTLWHYIHLRATVDLAFHKNICGLSLHSDVRKCLGLASFHVYRLKFRTLCCFDRIKHKVVIFFVAVFVVMKNMHLLLFVVLVFRHGLRLLFGPCSAVLIALLFQTYTSPVPCRVAVSTYIVCCWIPVTSVVQFSTSVAAV